MTSEHQILRRIRASGLVAVVVIDTVEDAVPLGTALLEGGIDIIELTLRTPAALESAQLIAKEVPEMLLGIGTILEPDQVSQARGLGASFGVAPGLNPRVVEQAQAEDFFFIPGVLTPSDIESALQFSLKTLKFFPAEPAGGVAYLKSLAAPYAHLGLHFLPLGGITPDHLGGYLNEDFVLAIGGSWVAPREKILARDWRAIATAARKARETVDRLRSRFSSSSHSRH